MKKTVSVLLTLALLFGLVLALPSAPARAESTPEQELTEAFQNLNAVDSMRMDLDIVLDLSIVMSMGGQTIINMPLNVALNLGMEYQKEPYAMRGQMQMHMSYMGKTEDNQSLMYSEKDGDTVISYSSDDDGATWTKKQSEKASFSMDDMSAVIGSAKEIQKIGTESVDGHDMDVYTAIVDGQYLQKAMNAAGSDNPLSGIVGETGSEDGSNGLGDFEVTIYVDKETKLPVRFSIDLTSMMKDLMDAALKASMDMSEMEGMEVSVDIPTALIDCNLSQFNSVQTIEIPEDIKANAQEISAEE